MAFNANNLAQLLLVLLHCALASCGAVYCNRSCL